MSPSLISTWGGGLRKPIVLVIFLLGSVHGLLAGPLPQGYKDLKWGSTYDEAKTYLVSKGLSVHEYGTVKVGEVAVTSVQFNEESGNEITLGFDSGKLDQYSVEIENLPNPLLSQEFKT